ncbi:MAG: hypothetical protein QG581_202, partial [Patescibacteria group bacterium]|nr:hypothetical protein [Patescibacteria group bacterium]
MSTPSLFSEPPITLTEINDGALEHFRGEIRVVFLGEIELAVLNMPH